MTGRLDDIVKAYDVRGRVGEQLDGRVARAFGSAFAQVIAVPEQTGRVMVGHDMRPSSPELSQAFAEGVAARGVDVQVVGLCSTDELYYASGFCDAPGAMFTASHNPATYNGIKMCRAGARPLSLDTGLDKIRDVAQSELDTAPGPHLGLTGPEGLVGSIDAVDLLGDYATFLRSLVDLRGMRPLTVVVDAGNGMGGLTAPAVLGGVSGLGELPVRLVPLYFELDGTFPNHEANPLDPANLRDLQAAVVREHADLGLAFDGDADRCFVVDEQGNAVSPSAITALVATREIAREVESGVPARQVRIVYNLISSHAVPEIIREHGAAPVRTRVGHSYIKAEMARHDAVFGGEHSAHYYFRDFWFADTGMLAALHVLAALGRQHRPLSALLEEFGRYCSSGEINSRIDNVSDAVERVRDWACTQAGVAEDRLDGLTLHHDGRPMWWLNVRASNTEPLLRLNVEAADAPTMLLIRDTALALIRQSDDSG